MRATYTIRPNASRGAVMRVNTDTGVHQAIMPGLGFDFPLAVALDTAGDSIVIDPSSFNGIDNRLIRLEVGGEVNIRDSPGFIFTGVAVEPTGNLVVTSDGIGTGNQKLLRFPPTSGGPIVLSQGDKIRAPSGVAVEASGAILVLDLTGAVIRVDPTTGA